MVDFEEWNLADEMRKERDSLLGFVADVDNIRTFIQKVKEDMRDALSLNKYGKGQDNDDLFKILDKRVGKL